MAKPSVEQIKDDSRFLFGDIDAVMKSGVDHFDEDGKQLIKFHGIYQQDDRDARKDRKKANLDLLYMFMVRSKLPGGKLTADQYLTHDRLSDQFGNKTFRLTTRQGIQFHGIFMNNLRQHIRELNEAMVSTLAACGDVVRNTMCCPAPIHDPIHADIQALADRIADDLCPKTPAYHAIWCNGSTIVEHYQKLEGAEPAEVEPIYGKFYLPRKFKIAIALPEDNCTDILSNDIGILALHDGQKITGYDIYAGGGMGTSHGNEKTYPRLATPVCFAPVNKVMDVVIAIVKVQRDFGNREDRKQARLKYTIDRMGQKEFRDKVQEYCGFKLKKHTGTPITGVDQHLGWNDQLNGKLWYGVWIPGGRVKDTPELPLKSTLRAVVERFRPSIRLTADHNLLLCDIDPKDREAIDQMLHGTTLPRPESLLPLARQAIACPAIPTCGLALSDSERVLPEIVRDLEAELALHELSQEDIVLHMTGCPNGCARPYNVDIGIVGRQPGKYKVFVGGNKLQTYLAFDWDDYVPHENIRLSLRPLFALFKKQRQDGERLGEFCQRFGIEKLRLFADGFHAAHALAGPA